MWHKLASMLELNTWMREINPSGSRFAVKNDVVNMLSYWQRFYISTQRHSIETIDRGQIGKRELDEDPNTWVGELVQPQPSGDRLWLQSTTSGHGWFNSYRKRFRVLHQKTGCTNQEWQHISTSLTLPRDFER